MFTRIALLSLVVLCQVAWAQSETSGFSIRGVTDVGYANTSGAKSWLRGGSGKLRFDEDDNDELQLLDIGIAIDYAFDLQSKFTVVGHRYDGDFALTEAFWEYRPLNDGAWRGRYRVGAFHPSFSLENTGPLWTSPYTVKSSAINTWFGEEMRIIGAEGKWTWIRDPHNKSKHRFSLFGALYAYNDPMGAMISWRGWSVHDRQIGLNGTFSIRDLPILQIIDHSPDFEPFMEIDDRPGFYVGSEWTLERRFRLQLVHYDNLTDHTLRQAGQYGWRTRFSQIAFHWRMGNGYEVLGQFLAGNTLMAKDGLDNDFEAAYVMLVKSWGRHRLAVRWDVFRVVNQSLILYDDNFEEYGDEDYDYDDDDYEYNYENYDYNDELGNSQTVSYSYLFGDSWKLSLEATRIWSRQDSRMHFGQNPRLAEKQVLASVRYYF
ncbi:MAG: hypothetical protein O7C67_20725 [Gammaproteobacteria bacterium]|nr:hypothetical protein [Gammaproteobacteria bacterium]